MSPQNVVAGLVVSANLGCTFDQTVGCVSPSFLRFGDRTTRVIRSKGLDHYRYLGRTLGSVVIECGPTISHHRIWCGKIILRFLRVRSNVPLDVQLELTSHRSHLFASDLNEDVISLVVAPVRGIWLRPFIISNGRPLLPNCGDQPMTNLYTSVTHHFCQVSGQLAWVEGEIAHTWKVSVRHSGAVIPSFCRGQSRAVTLYAPSLPLFH